MKTRDELDRLSGIILDSAITVHKEMGPGLLESVYQHCLITELKFRRLYIDSLVPVPLSYKGNLLQKEYIINLLLKEKLSLN
jgi:GxxExxY protein